MSSNSTNIDPAILTSILGEKRASEKYAKLGIKYNPFPRSGTTNINGNDIYNRFMIPIDPVVLGQLNMFISNSLANNEIDNTDKFISATVLGNYGSGKTQLLMYTRFLLNMIATSSDYEATPYVIYIDNPGVSLLEFIGNIIARIGEENLRKYLWNNIINVIDNEYEYKNILLPYVNNTILLFDTENKDPFAAENRVSYKQFLTVFTRNITTTDKRKKFDLEFRNLLLKVLDYYTKDSVVSYYFYEFISGDYGVNKTWEALTSGSLKQLKGKEARVIKYIVKLVKEQGFSDFFILVDEFEDITEGCLTKSQIDNYVYNLRTLLDEQREWCLMFTMTPLALKKLRSVSPPLADRISSREIWLQDLNTEQAISIVKNYMTIVEHDSLLPFTEDGIAYLVDIVDGNIRRFLKMCFRLIEEAALTFTSPDNKIDKAFIESQNLLEQES